jgi:carboxylesterase type B
MASLSTGECHSPGRQWAIYAGGETEPASWKGVRKADAFAPACIQDGVSMPGEVPPKVSEDCLYLNIWTAAKSTQEHLAVIVWIYGGGYTNGSASMPLYWGTNSRIKA